MKIHWLQHVPFETLGNIEVWANRHDIELSVTQWFADEPVVPNDEALNDLDGLIIMGGPMSANDEQSYPWLEQEKALINQFIEADKPVLGICLGAQLIAAALGADVTAADYKEIGWWPVRTTKLLKQTPFAELMPDRFPALHWHSETFELPKDAHWIAQTDAVAHQAFVYKDNVIGLQFHLESTTHTLKQLIEHCADDVFDTGRFIQDVDSMLAQTANTAKTHPIMHAILNELFKPAAAEMQEAGEEQEDNAQ